MRDQLNAGATSETAQTWNTMHIRHKLIHSNKANMKWWLWRPNDIRETCGTKVSWHLSYRWGKTPKTPHTGNLSRPEIESVPAARQAWILPHFPQRWTLFLLPAQKGNCVRSSYRQARQKDENPKRKRRLLTKEKLDDFAINSISVEDFAKFQKKMSTVCCSIWKTFSAAMWAW